ncbi:Enterochelin esterase OS=Streptomyces tendae OX=1932 GN=GUR47_06020 PE=4 SV=1 [Streptomyces tendae]
MELTGHEPFAAFGVSGAPGTEAFWAGARSPASVPDGDGWKTLFLRRGGEDAAIGFESWSDPVPLRRWVPPTAGTRRCACPRDCV